MKEKKDQPILRKTDGLTGRTTNLYIYRFPGSSVVVPIVTLGCFAGIGSCIFPIYSLNLVGKAFSRFRPIAMALSNLGVPIGCLVMPYVSGGLLIR